MALRFAAGAIAAVVVVVFTLVTPRQARAQDSPDTEQYLLGEYWAVVKRYAGPESAKAVKEMTAWTRDRIGKVQSLQFQPEGSLPATLEVKAEWSPALLRAAAMMHTEIALAAYRQRPDDFTYQTGIADGWLSLADNRKSLPGSLRSRWHIALAAFLLNVGDVTLAEREMLRTNERIADDPALMLMYGTVKEAQAARMLAKASSGRWEPPAQAAPARTAALAAAIGHFERALAKDPALEEARLRIAHVLTLQGQDSRAEPLLKHVLSAKPTPALAYLANLMLGGIRERAGELDPAARLYVAAIQAVPDGQSGYLALARVLQRANQRDGAATVLDCLFSRGRLAPSADPWWIYGNGLEANLEARFSALLAEARK